MIKYVNYGNPKYGTHMYVISMFRTDDSSYMVEVKPCDIYGCPVSDAVIWDIIPSWWSARKFAREQYKEFYDYVNSGR